MKRVLARLSVKASAGPARVVQVPERAVDGKRCEAMSTADRQKASRRLGLKASILVFLATWLLGHRRLVLRASMFVESGSDRLGEATASTAEQVVCPKASKGQHLVSMRT